MLAGVWTWALTKVQHVSLPFILLQDWDSYGIDWNRPVSTDGDATVPVPEFVNELTTPLVAEYLQQHLSGVAGDNVLHYLVASTADQ